MFTILLSSMFFLLTITSTIPAYAQGIPSDVPNPACLGSCPSGTQIPDSGEQTGSIPDLTNGNLPGLGSGPGGGSGSCQNNGGLLTIILQLVSGFIGNAGGGSSSSCQSNGGGLLSQILQAISGIESGGGDLPQTGGQDSNPQISNNPNPTQTAQQPTAAPETPAPTQSGGNTDANPTPPIAGMRLVFREEFNGTSVDTSKWSFVSSAESTCDAEGCSNPGNQQLEYNSGANCSVSGGLLTITAKRENKKGRQWTSCMLHSKQKFQNMYMEERAKLPSKKGFWPSFWTWNGPSQEIDVYEFYSDNHTKLYMTSHAGGGGGCQPTPSFDPSAGFHVYAADIRADGVTWYVDGQQVCTASGTISQPVSILNDMFVYEKIPPDASTNSETKVVDYMRVWQR